MGVGVSGNYSKSSQKSTSSSQGGSWVLDDFLKELLGSVQVDTMSGGVPQGPGYVGPNQQQMDALGQMGLGGQTGQYYQGIMSGQGQPERYNALQALNQASADQASQALGMNLAGVQSASGAVGQAGSSRSGIAQGLTAASSVADLAAIQAQQNQAFLGNEQALMGNAANALQGIAGNQFGAGSILQQWEKDKAESDFSDMFGQTNTGKLAYYMNLISGLSGLGGSSSSTGTSSGSGWGVAGSAQFGNSGI